MKYAKGYIDQRDVAIGLVEDSFVDAVTMLKACLNYMSMDDVRDMMLSNNFIDEAEDEEEEEEDDEDEDDEEDEGVNSSDPLDIEYDR